MPDDKVSCKTRLCTILENANIPVCKSCSEHSHSSHLSKPKVNQAMANIKEVATNSQQSLRALIIDSLVRD